MSGYYLPGSVQEIFAKGFLQGIDLVDVRMRGQSFKIMAKHLIVSPLLSRELLTKVVSRLELGPPLNSELITLSHDRNPLLFVYVQSYLEDPKNWVCVNTTYKPALYHEAHYFQLDGMVDSLAMKYTPAKPNMSYIRIELEKDQIDVPSEFGTEVHGIAGKLCVQATIHDYAHRAKITAHRQSKDVMDKVVGYFLSHGFEIIAINDFQDRSVYHFRAQK